MSLSLSHTLTATIVLKSRSSSLCRPVSWRLVRPMVLLLTSVVRSSTKWKCESTANEPHRRRKSLLTSSSLSWPLLFNRRQQGTLNHLLQVLNWAWSTEFRKFGSLAQDFPIFWHTMISLSTSCFFSSAQDSRSRAGIARSSYQRSFGAPSHQPISVLLLATFMMLLDHHIGQNA